MDQVEFTELLRAGLPAIQRFVLRMVGNRFDAEDVVQETAMKAFMHFTEFRGEAKFRTWLVSIARNEVRSQRRREATSRISYVEADQLAQRASAELTASPDRAYQNRENGRLLKEAMASLRVTERDVLRLRAFDGCAIADTARRLSISIAATKTRYHRGLRHLYAALTRPTKPLRATPRWRAKPAAPHVSNHPDLSRGTAPRPHSSPMLGI